ncbi:MAG TPA: DUF1552 domain-containing protein [Polyangiaceae bacterium]|nr:DUF1552 domain-containing protein [Polyangiaceae bacterium]
MTNKRHHVYTRRNILRGIGAGGLLLLPFVRNRSSMAQTATPAGNLLIFFTPNGFIKSRDGMPAFDASGTTGASFVLGPSLAALESQKADITVLRGMTNKVCTTNNSHDDIVRITTCWQGPDKGLAYGPSVDNVIGDAIGQLPMYVNPEPNRDSAHWRNSISWRGAQGQAPSQYPFLKDPGAVYTNLFGNGVGTGAPAMPDQALERAKARNQTLLDFVNDDIQTFRARINNEDKAHLDLYLDSLQAVGQRVISGPTTTGAGGGVCAPDTVQARIAGLPVTPVQNDDKSPPGLAADLQANGEVLVDLLAAGFACGTQRVSTILWQGASEGLDPFKDTGSPDHHSVSHSSDLDTWTGIDRWYVDRFAYTLNSLRTVGMLDKTIVVWLTEIAQGHETGDYVWILAGGQSLGFKTGQRVEYPFMGNPGDKAALADPANRPIGDLWVTVQQAMGIQSNTFGDPQWCTGPLTEIRTA